MSLTYNNRSNPLLSCVGNLPGGSIYVYKQERKSPDWGSTSIQNERSAPIPVQNARSAPIPVHSLNQDHINKLQDLSLYQEKVISALNAELSCSNYDGELIDSWDVNAILRTLYNKFSYEKVHTILTEIQKDPDIYGYGDGNDDSDWFIETPFDLGE